MASIDKRPSGQYRARWREYANGPQKTRSFDRKRDAERWLTEVEHGLMTGAYIDPALGRVTLRDFSAVYVERQPWRPSTRSTATGALAHVLPVLGDRPLSAIRRGDVQAVLTGLALAPSTVGLVRQHLTGVLEAAVLDGLIAKNPAHGVRVERQHREVIPPTVEQVAALVTAAPSWFAPAIVLGAGCGLRQAEVSGLTADRIDWLGRAVRVDRQWIGHAKPPGFGPPKTAASNRTVPASDHVLQVLSAHVGRGAHEGHVLRQPNGAVVHHTAFREAWAATCRRAGVEGVRFHDLRHFYASALIAGGCSVRAVQSALGHSSAATTLQVYAHLWPGDEDRIRGAVAAVFAPPAEDSLRTATLRPVE
jgi:integrase